MNLDWLKPYFDGIVTPLIRTDFSDDAAWERVVSAVLTPVDFGGDPDDYEDDGYVPNVKPIVEPALENVSASDLGKAYGNRHDLLGYVLLADSRSMNDLTVGYVDLCDQPGRSFRCAVGEAASIESNLSISNLEFREFADAVEPDRVFRRFPDP